MPPYRCCTLCRSDNTYDLFCGGKIYYRCRQCRLVFLDPQFYLDPIEEKARYDRYENDVEDPDYRSFLSRSFNEAVCGQGMQPRRRQCIARAQQQRQHGQGQQQQNKRMGKA